MDSHQSDWRRGVLCIGTMGATFSPHLRRFGGDGVGGVRKQVSFGRAPSLDHSGGNPLNYSLSESKIFPLVPFLSSNSHAYPLKDTRVHGAGFFSNAMDRREIPGLSFDSAHR